MGAPAADGSGAGGGVDRHRSTLDVYESRALDWERRRPPRMDEAQDFTRTVAQRGLGRTALPGAGIVVDLGCGPGWHLGALPPGTIALDASSAMLGRVSSRCPDTPRVQADLRALPVRGRSLAAVWANKSYVHLQRSLVPMALRDLHRAMAVGAIAHIGLFGGDVEHDGFAGDEFAGRSFSLWPEALLADVLTGAGFGVERITVAAPDHHRAEVPYLLAEVTRLESLADTVGPGMRLLLVGLNPSPHAAESAVGFSGPNNRGWPALLRSGLASVDRDPDSLLADGRIGMTDLVKRTTRKASELRAGEFRAGLDRLERLCAWLQPAAVCVIGLTGWRTAVDRHASAGHQRRRLGGRPVWLMPNPSGLNAQVSLDELAHHFTCAAELADRSAPPAPS